MTLRSRQAEQQGDDTRMAEGRRPEEQQGDDTRMAEGRRPEERLRSRQAEQQGDDARMAEGRRPEEGRPAESRPAVRTCVGCRRQAGPDELYRVVRGADGSLLVGRTLPGRGAWLCAGSLRCVQRAAQRNALSRALRAPVSPEAVLALRPDRPA